MMRLLTSLIASSLFLASPALQGEDAKDISIHSRSKNTAPIIIVRSKYDFTREISLKLKTDPALTPSEALIRTVSKFKMVDAKGIKITSGFDIDVGNNLVVAFSGGTSEIIKIAGDPSSLEIIASFKDVNGNYISPPSDSVALYSLNGQKLCFDYTTINKDPKIAIALLLDHSGSMSEELEDVKKTAKYFLSLLPHNAMCAVGSFDTSVHYAHDHYQACGGGGFGIDQIGYGGGTDIYNALNGAYKDLSQSGFDGYQKAVIIVTDGYTISDEKRKAELLARKHKTLTFVHFIGGHKDDDLKGITDHFFVNQSDFKFVLPLYFKTIGQAYATQKILRVKPCGKS